MNEKNPHEIEYRRQAFKLFEKGKSVAHILKRIPRSRSWLFKWKERFERGGWQALDSLPKAPVNSPQEHSEETIELVLRIRERLERSEIGLLGPHEIREEIKRNRLMESPPRWRVSNGGSNKPDIPRRWKTTLSRHTIQLSMQPMAWPYFLATGSRAISLV